MFNFSGSEIVFLLLLALIILGPEKLPEAIRKFGKTYAEFKKVTTGFQTELKQALDEPMREMRETAEMFKQAASLDLMNPMEEAASALKSIADPTPAALPSSDVGDTDGAVDAAAGAAPPLARAAAEATTASESDEHKPFESKVISGGQKMRSLDEVLAATQADAAKADAAKAEAAKATATDSAAVSSRPAGPAFHSAAPRVTPPVETPRPSTETPADQSDPGAPVVADTSGGSAEDEQGPGTA